MAAQAPGLPKAVNLSQQPLHWLGDRKNIEDFNATFMSLQANDLELTTNEMAEFKAMLASTFFPPNFLRTFSNSLPASLPLPGLYGRVPTNGGPRMPLPPGNALRGFSKFDQGNCRICHDSNQGRDIVDGQLLSLPRSGTQGAFKSSQLRSLAEKSGFDGFSTNSRAGFGLLHDGGVDTLTTFLVQGFPEVVPTDQSVADLVAFLLCFTGSDLTPNPSSASQDVPAAAGRQVSFQSPSAPPLLNTMLALAMRTNSRVELVLRGRTNAVSPPRQWLFRRSPQNFQSDRHGEIAPTLGSVIAAAVPGSPFTALLVPEGSGVRLALDRDGDGYFDTSELDTGFNPADPSSHPGRIVSIVLMGSSVVLG